MLSRLRSLKLRTATVASVAALAAAALVLPGVADAQHGRRGAPCHRPRRPDERRPDPEHRPGQDRDQGLLRGHGHSTPDPVDGSTVLPSSRPPAPTRRGVGHRGPDQVLPRDRRSTHPGSFDGTPAIIFDIDDTTLTTYDYEIYSNFVYNPTTNGKFVDNAVFPATPGMVHLTNWARSRRLHGLLPDRPPRDTTAGHADQPGQRGLPSVQPPGLPQGPDAPLAQLVHPELHE